jgi:hypothetical protein
LITWAIRGMSQISFRGLLGNLVEASLEGINPIIFIVF